MTTNSQRRSIVARRHSMRFSWTEYDHIVVQRRIDRRGEYIRRKFGHFTDGDWAEHYAEKRLRESARAEKVAEQLEVMSMTSWARKRFSRAFPGLRQQLRRTFRCR